MIELPERIGQKGKAHWTKNLGQKKRSQQQMESEGVGGCRSTVRSRCHFRGQLVHRSSSSMEPMRNLQASLENR